jgi:hypothetical protein
LGRETIQQRGTTRFPKNFPYAPNEARRRAGGETVSHSPLAWDAIRQDGKRRRMHKNNYCK